MINIIETAINNDLLMILDDISSMNGKITMINQYLYSLTVLKNNHPNLSSSLDNIFNTELKQLKILMELVVSLGGDPRLWTYHNDQCEYWSPAYLNYPVAPAIIIDTLIKQNYLAIETYSKQVVLTKNNQIKAFLNQLIIDEKQHLIILRNWKTKLVNISN